MIIEGNTIRVQHDTVAHEFTQRKLKSAEIIPEVQARFFTRGELPKVRYEDEKGIYEREISITGSTITFLEEATVKDYY